MIYIPIDYNLINSRRSREKHKLNTYIFISLSTSEARESAKKCKQKNIYSVRIVREHLSTENYINNMYYQNEHKGNDTIISNVPLLHRALYDVLSI